MPDWGWALVGFIVGPLLVWLATLLNRDFVVKYIVSLLEKFVKDKKTRNKVENVWGVVIALIGLKFITAEPDDTYVKERVEKIQNELEELKKYFE